MFTNRLAHTDELVDNAVIRPTKRDALLKSPKFAGALPSDFLWACAGASYQIEGGWDADGKGVGIWDHYLNDKPDNGKEACDSYHLWREDIKLLKKYGCNAYRFSVSWPRVKPLGGSNDPVNEAGIKYYSDLIDALLAEAIQPCITIFHWDTPQELEHRYGAFAGQADIVRDFVSYAELLFERFGDRVKFWITINEPLIYMMLNGLALKNDTWVNATDTWITSKTLLLAHARTVEAYRRSNQDGKIGITLNCEWVEPLDDSKAAKLASQASLDRIMGLFADPIYLGKFPESLHEEIGDRVPTFTDEEWLVVKGSSDFFGLNHYGTSYATGERIPEEGAAGFDYQFGLAVKVTEKDGVQIGNKGQNGHPFDVPWGFRKLLQYIDSRYNLRDLGIQIYITENGFAVDGEAEMSLAQAVNDTQRQEYFAGYLKEMFEAILDDGVPIGGYMAWSIMDNLEWVMGYTPRFGITAVDREHGFVRHPKDSALMLRDIFGYVRAQ